MNADNVQMTLRVSCTAGYFNGVLDAYIHRLGGTSLCRGTSEFFDLTAGQTKVVTFNVPFKNAVVGMSYQAAIFDYNVNPCTMLTSFQAFTVGMKSGLSDIAADAHGVMAYPSPARDVINVTVPDAIEQVEIYSLSGTKVLSREVPPAHQTIVDVETLTPGFYLLQVQTTHTRHTLRIVKE